MNKGNKVNMNKFVDEKWIYYKEFIKYLELVSFWFFDKGDFLIYI